MRHCDIRTYLLNIYVQDHYSNLTIPGFIPQKNPTITWGLNIIPFLLPFPNFISLKLGDGWDGDSYPLVI